MRAGQAAIVTGAGGGLAHAVAEDMVRAGVSLALTDLKETDAASFVNGAVISADGGHTAW